MKKKIKLKGQLKVYLLWPIWLTVLLLIVTLVIFNINIESAIVMGGITIFYFTISMVLYLKNRQGILNEMVSFATEYAQVQKQFLYHLELPYGLLDEQGRILWANEKLIEVLLRTKYKKKMITSFFPEIKKSFFQSEEEELTTEAIYDEKNFRLVMQKIAMNDIVADGTLVEYPEEGVYLIAFYMVDETTIKYYMQENEDQRLISGLIYIDNYRSEERRVGKECDL